MKIGPSEAKYLRLTFAVNEPGRIANLGVYSTPNVSAFTMPRARKTDAKSGSVAMVSYNVTDLHAKARAVYVSSGEDVKQANNMIDDQPGTVYNFAPPDAAPTAVVDLGKVTKVTPDLGIVFAGSRDTRLLRNAVVARRAAGSVG